MCHEPGRLVCHAQHPMELVSTDAFLRGAHEMNRGEPLTERQMGILEDRADHHRKLLAAGRTFQHLPLGTSDLQAVYFVGITVRTDRPFRPT